MDSLALPLLEDHSHGCLQDAVRAGKGTKSVAELMNVVKRFTRQFPARERRPPR